MRMLITRRRCWRFCIKQPAEATRNLAPDEALGLFEQHFQQVVHDV